MGCDLRPKTVGARSNQRPGLHINKPRRDLPSDRRPIDLQNGEIQFAIDFGNVARGKYNVLPHYAEAFRDLDLIPASAEA